jgi:F-type H+-transporting ATPase subunit b
MLEINIPTFIFAAINLTVLYLAMKKFLFKPVTEFMERRKKSISDSLEKVAKEMAEAGDMKKEYAELLKSARKEAEKIVSSANSRANAEYDSIIKKAGIEADKILATAKEEIEKEKQKSLAGIRNEVAGLALLAASKVIEKNMDTESNREFVDKILDEAGAA